MQTTKQTSKEYFSILTILHLALTAGQILFGLVAFLLLSNGQFSAVGEGQAEIFKLLVPILVIGGLAGGILVARTRLQSIKAKMELKEKMAGYRTALLIKYVLWEGPSLIALVAYLLTGNYLFLGLSALVIAVFLLNRPTIAGAVNDLELSQKEKSLIEDPQAIVV